MPFPLIAPAIAGYNQMRKGPRARDGLDEWIKRLYAKSNDGQLPPVPADLNPMATGEVAKIEDYVRGIQQTQGSQKAAAWMAQMMDPLQETPRQQADVNLQADRNVLANQQTSMEAYNALLGNEQLPGMFGNLPGGRELLTAAGPAAGSQAIMQSMLDPDVRGKTVGTAQKLDNGNYGVVTSKTGPDGNLQLEIKDMGIKYRDTDTLDIGGIKYAKSNDGWLPIISPEDQRNMIIDGEDAAKTGQLTAMAYDQLKGDATARLNSIKNLTDIRDAIQSGELGTGVVEGRVALPSEMRDLLYREQLIAARAALKESGETKMTDADVEQMRQAMFGNTLTEEFNVRILNQTLDSLQNREKRYQTMRLYRIRKGLEQKTAADYLSEAQNGQP